MGSRLKPSLGWGAFAPAAAFALAGRWATPAVAGLLYIAFNALLNLPHHYFTWRRAAQEVPPGRMAWVFLAMLAVVTAIAADLLGPTREAMFANFLPYWGLWHLVSQHFGVSAILRSRGGERAGLKGDRLFFVSLFTLGVLRFHAVNPLEVPLGASVAKLWRLPMPTALAHPFALGCGALFALACVGWLVPAWRANPLRAKYQSLAAAATFAAFFLCDNLLMTIAAVTAMHNVQYIGIVAEQQAGRAANDARVRPLRWRDFGLAAAYSLAVNAAFLVSLRVGEVLIVTLIALHYAVDGRIWRFRTNPRLATDFALTPRAAAPAGS